MKHIISVISLTWLFFASGQVQAYQQVIDLGTLANDSSWAYSINDSGQIVGYTWYREFNTKVPVSAVLFDSRGSGANRKIGGLWVSSAYSINNTGQIVGQDRYSSGHDHATLFNTTGGSNRDLGTLGGEDAGNDSWGSHAWSINNNGQIVGWAKTSSDEFHACLFDSTGQGNNIDLGTLGYGSEAYSINDRGQIVGYSNASPGYSAYLFDSSVQGNNKNLGTLGGDHSWAYSINNASQIVGYAAKSDGLNSACLFDISGNGANTDLGDLGGYISFAWSINNNNQIVGRAMNSSGEFRACLFDPTGRGNNIDLNTLLDPSSGWLLIDARSINNNGYIVGCGINPEGDYSAFLLTPEPVTLLLLGLGAVMLRKRR
jgi:probable HAF family extracellular repeat protein